MKKILFGLLPLLVIFAGCEGLKDESISKEDFESVFEYEFNENVKYYDEDLTEFVSLVNDTTMFIKSAMPTEHVPEIGDVILCTSTHNTPHGFLRRVVSIENRDGGMIILSNLSRGSIMQNGSKSSETVWAMRFRLKSSLTQTVPRPKLQEKQI